MKKILVALFLLTTIAFAADAIDKRMETMQGLEKALASIQKGYLYNNASIVKKGVRDFKSYLRHNDAFIIDLKAEEKTGEFSPRRYASTEVRAIDKLADGILENFKTGSKEKSVEYYNQTVNRCFTCHRIIRKW